jgi:hypothetical protein
MWESRKNTTVIYVCFVTNPDGLIEVRKVVVLYRLWGDFFYTSADGRNTGDSWIIII